MAWYCLNIMKTINHKCHVCNALIQDAGLGSACAQCGVRVTAEVQTIRESKPSSYFLLAAGIGLFAIAAREIQFGRWEAHQILTLGLCVLVTWFFVSRRPNEVVLWDGGVVLIERGNKPCRIGWKGVAAVHANPELNRIEFIGASGTMIDSFSIELLGTWRRAERFIEAASPYIVSSTSTAKTV